jgi:hypothetical protein
MIMLMARNNLTAARTKNAVMYVSVASGILAVAFLLAFTWVGQSFGASSLVGYAAVGAALLVAAHLVLAAMKVLPAWRWNHWLGGVIVLLAALPVCILWNDWTISQCSEVSAAWLFGKYGLVCPLQQLGWAALVSVGLWAVGYVLFSIDKYFRVGK